jgi:hypothetical protein
MPTFKLERRLPSCLVTKDLLSAIEAYLNVEMRQKLGEVHGNKIEYRLSIRETIGTEVLASANEYTPNLFSDGTKEIEIRWENGYRAVCHLDIVVEFESSHFSSSKLRVTCTAPTARETAVGIGENILRLLESRRTYNWVFNPFEFPIVPFVAFSSAGSLLAGGLGRIFDNQEQALYLLSASAIFGWFFLSSVYFRPFIAFDSRRQRLLDGLWRYFSLGVFGFAIFGTLFPLLRKAILGF